METLSRLNPVDLGPHHASACFRGKRSLLTRALFRVPDDESVVSSGSCHRGFAGVAWTHCVCGMASADEEIAVIDPTCASSRPTTVSGLAITPSVKLYCQHRPVVFPSDNILPGCLGFPGPMGRWSVRLVPPMTANAIARR